MFSILRRTQQNVVNACVSSRNIQHYKPPRNYYHFTMPEFDSRYKLVEHGSKYSTDYSAYLYDGKLKTIVSPFHDIPLYVNESEYSVNMVVEIPRWTNAKLEINTKTEFNPIKQDVKKGLPRFVHNMFPFHGYPWNYGAIPQTWEDPSFVDPHTHAKGDNDPVDVIDIGSKLLCTGDVVPVKVVGCVALIDEGETDWKIIAINEQDPKASKVTSLETLEQEFPGVLEGTINWLRNYKVPAGSGQNKFAFEGDLFKDRDFAMKVIKDSYAAWKKLTASEYTGLCLIGASDPQYNHYAESSKVNSIMKKCTKKEESAIPCSAHDQQNVDLKKTSS